MGADHGGLDVLMTEQLLNRPDIVEEDEERLTCLRRDATRRGRQAQWQYVC
jgi:hypothetical protein